MGNRESDVARRPLLTPTAIANVAFVPTGIVTVLLGPILPTLAAHWSLNDTQGGVLFFVQFVASTGGVVLSGALVPRFGYRVVLVLGLIFVAAGVSTLLLGSWVWGMVSVAGFGFGQGLIVPTGNLLVAELNPETKASALTLVNFSWSVGAVACPSLLAPFQRAQRTSTFLWALAACVLVVAVSLAWIALPPLSKSREDSDTSEQSLGSLMRTPAAIALAVLFFTYVGTETAVGGWLASYAKRIMRGAGTMWVTTPSFFYGGLLSGRILTPALLRRVPEVKLARMSMIVALLGVVGLLASPSVPGVMVGAAVVGVGLSPVYPIVIALLLHRFGAAATRLGSVMFALAGLGAACVPLIVGFTSTQMSSLKFGLGVPLLGCAVMLRVLSRDWSAAVA
jgi:FHS family glucose/mannose:H+ symporter-like MFS transporter